MIGICCTFTFRKYNKEKSYLKKKQAAVEAQVTAFLL